MPVISALLKEWKMNVKKLNIHCWQSRIATTVSFLHRQLSSEASHDCEGVRSAEEDSNMYLPGSLRMRGYMPSDTGPIKQSKGLSFFITFP